MNNNNKYALSIVIWVNVHCDFPLVYQHLLSFVFFAGMQLI